MTSRLKSVARVAALAALALSLGKAAWAAVPPPGNCKDPGPAPILHLPAPPDWPSGLPPSCHDRPDLPACNPGRAAILDYQRKKLAWDQQTKAARAPLMSWHDAALSYIDCAAKVNLLYCSSSLPGYGKCPTD